VPAKTFQQQRAEVFPTTQCNCCCSSDIITVTNHNDLQSPVKSLILSTSICYS